MTTHHWQFKWPLFGNGNIIDFLEKSIASRQLANCYIIAGPSGVGKNNLANSFAQALLCDNLKKQGGELPCGECGNCQQTDRGAHRDLIKVQRDLGKKNISIEQIRSFIYAMQTGSFSSNYKVGIIKEAEALNSESSNALLKTLEEHQPGVVIILTTVNLDDLPETVRSRSQIISLKPVSSSDIYDYILGQYNITRDGAKQISRLAAGRPALAVKLAQDKEFFQETKNTLNKIIELIKGNAAVKMQTADELLSQDNSGETAEQARGILQLWQSIIRDRLLLEYGLGHILINEVVVDKIKSLSLSKTELLKMNEAIGEAEKYLNANVNPKLVLESVYL